MKWARIYGTNNSGVNNSANFGNVLNGKYCYRNPSFHCPDLPESVVRRFRVLAIRLTLSLESQTRDKQECSCQENRIGLHRYRLVAGIVPPMRQNEHGRGTRN